MIANDETLVSNDLIHLPFLLRLPETPGKCSFGIQEIRRILREKELKELISSRVNFDEGLPSQDEMFTIVSNIKWDFIKKDLSSLADRIDALYRERLDKLNFSFKHQSPDMLYQIVEIPWTLREFTPGNSSISYRVFSKREIAVR